jgi:hypothetical protein
MSAINVNQAILLQSLLKCAGELGTDVLATIDGDRQHPRGIPRLVKPITDEKADVVLGSYFKDANGAEDMPVYRQFGVKVLTKLANDSTNSGLASMGLHAV